jgi:hypothetical protein
MTYKWEYHSKGSKQGRGLWLLSSNEVDYFWSRFEGLFKGSELSEKYNPFVRSSSIEQDLLLLNRYKRVGSELTPIELASLNLHINRFFTDDGWRSIRKLINRDLSEKKKRKERELVAEDEQLTIATEWYYSGVKPTRGKQLKLLIHEELEFCLPILIATLGAERKMQERAFRGHLAYSDSFIDRGLKCARLKRQLIKLLAKIETIGSISNNELLSINVDCNGLFSDHGWKQFRAKQAQKKRRTNKSLVELTSDTVSRLVTLKNENNFESLDDTIGYLFDESDTNPELVKLHKAMDEIGLSTYAELTNLISKLS